MKCEHPQCTGRHNSETRSAELSPAALEKRRATDHRYKERNQDKIRECNRLRARQYRKANPEKFRERERQRQRKKNPDKSREYNRRSYEKHRDGVLERTRQRIKANKTILDDHKRAHPCPCGERELTKLHFHHLDPRTKVGCVANMRTHTRTAVLREISKCVILCNRCHKTLHIRLARAA